MKKTYFLPLALCCLLTLAACGKKAKETDDAPRYYEIRVADNGQLRELESGQFLLGQQYYQGRPVNLIAETAASGETADVMDVYLLSTEGDKKLLMSGVSRKYRVRGWYLDEKGRCFVRGTTDITGLDKDGNPLYQSTLSGMVLDICCTKKGRVILLTQSVGSGRSLVELNPDTGSVTPIENISLDLGQTYINSLDNDLLILDNKGVWQVDLKGGSKNLLLSFVGTLFSLENGESITDFRSDGKGADLLRSSGQSERLEWVDISSEKEVITLRAAYPDRLKESLNLFNQSNDAYYVVLEEPGLDSMDFLERNSALTVFQAETNSKLASGKGADIICSDALYDDISAFIEKGVFADLAPLMAASGMRAQDYSTAAFDAWRDGDKIYGIVPYIRFGGMSVDKALSGGSGELTTMEAFVDSLLAFEEDMCFSKYMDSVDILRYFLRSSESLCGMVDWEKGTCDFNGELFSKMLLAAKRYGADEARQYPELTGRRECSSIYEFDIEQKLEADNRAPLNYFFDDGIYPRSDISDGNEIIMGINAASELQEGAWQLLAFLLGEEAQTTMTGKLYLDQYFPVSLNVFDRLAKAELEYGETHVNSYSGETVFIPGRYLGSKYGRVVLEGQAVAEMRRMLSEARTYPYKAAPLIGIIAEETAYYFDGAKSMEEVIALVQNRVQLYLDEHTADR